MKKTLLMLLVLFITNEAVFGQCQEGIELKKDSRDWVKTYDKLAQKYKSKDEKISSLKSFFYANDKAKKCISLKDLQLLNSKIQEISKATKSDKTVTDFIGAISSIAKNNPPSTQLAVIEKAKKESPTTLKKDSVNEILDRQNVAEIGSLGSEIENLEKENVDLTSDKKFYKTGCLLILILLIGLTSILLLMNRNLSKELKGEIQSLKNTIEEQREHYTKTIKELEAKNRENKTTFKESVSTVEVKKDVTAPVEEIRKTTITESPKVSQTIKQFYLSNPTPSDGGLGIFRDIRQNQESPTNSFYRFVLEHDETKAKFWFLNNQNTIQSAIYYPETYIIPACEYSGLNAKVIKVTVKTPGMAKKVGDNWQVQTKAEVVFE